LALIDGVINGLTLGPCHQGFEEVPLAASTTLSVGITKTLCSAANLAKSRIRKDVRQTISSGRYGLTRLALRRDVDDDKSIAPVSCGDHVFELLFGKSRICMLVDDLDVVS
jgi:hypothetical protein